MKPIEEYKMEPHKFTIKVLNYQVCVHCGLVTLKNSLTEWAISKGCLYKDHPSYKYKIKQYTRLFE